ncbi:acyl carrier protein [Micromonospora sp. HUAS LYJ1]|nr:acyl carrier protein [Micromonospora sp. HUAS LYJ1]WKU07215.1 acyl carrier protein [Micromonospora sp. HUAS LYJ1]
MSPAPARRRGVPARPAASAASTRHELIGDDMGNGLSDVSATIGELMGTALMRGPLAPDEDFFDCGGDSVRAVDVLQRLIDVYRPAGGQSAEALRSTLLETIFEDATPAGLAAVCAAHAAVPAVIDGGPRH